MPTAKQLELLAGAANVLRPDWPVQSILTFLTREHARRPFRDLAVALAYVAADAATATPRRLSEHGPWWDAVAQSGGEDPGRTIHFDRCPLPGHGSYPVTNCSACRSELIAVDDSEENAP
ncbi:hypothetical protein [Cellulomonas xylanilytica]|uniref:Uncharacterized protein n=1 Tax=Cellulomonas xylanilytica TaxID=233583 RepID=A0A510V2B4_9CELL|nr:hypothetical protein [Cellulomonas xylanilytica]GEK20998.1 hypothetical protein CXY01_15180 [Cellulomonas xylanilytica]